jgi:NAD(P)H-hydrate epimerase
MSISVPEAIMQLDKEETIFTQPADYKGYEAIGIGPGLGQNENTAIAVIAQIRSNKTPMVLDADALNILASHRAWMQQLPEGLILTPHPRELDRLVGVSSSDDFERLTRARELSQQLQAYVILKGHYSALCMPNGHIIFNSTGNAGMATAGSGDVLTGIITGLLARGYSRENAAIMGMYLHGIAGDLAAEELGEESLTAGDIINYLPKAFCQL